MQLKLILYFYCLLNVAFNFTVGINLWKKYSEYRKKINKLLNKHQGSELLLRTNEYEYPRANETLRKVHKELWQEYYDCLEKAYNEIGSEKIMHPIALEALKGTSAILKCEMCISPIEIYESDNIEWYFNSTVNNITNKFVEESDNTFISPEDRTLIMYNIKTDQAGQYWCKLGDTLSVSYHVFIDNDTEGVTIVYPATAPNMPHAVPEKYLADYNINIHTTWTKWSPCSKCNVVGKKVRYGYCTVSLDKRIIKRSISIKKRHLQDYKRQITEVEQSTTLETTNLKDKMKMVLRTFRNKLPCKSKYLPKEIRNIPDVKNRKTEMMERYCKIMCPQNIIFQVRDNKGNVLESANNSAGIYSMVQGVPDPLPPVIRATIYQKYNKKAIVICPGSPSADIPINWKVGNKVLNPSVINEQSQGRIFINSQMHIIFESLKFEDTNIYSCWQKNDIIGVINLSVTGEIELETNHSAIMVGGILIIVVFLIVFWKAFQGRKRYTIH